MAAPTNATLELIASRAGVSRKTVARALAGEHRGRWASTADRIDRIRRIAQDLGYRPNVAAKAVRTGRFGCITLLISEVHAHSIVFDSLIRGIQDVTDQARLRLMTARLPDTVLTDEQAVPKILSEQHSDGLLINYFANYPDRMVQLIRNYNVPSIWLNSKLEQDTVRPDDFAAGRAAAEHLLQLGHTRIAYLDYRSKGQYHYSMDDRRDGYAAAMVAAGLAPQIVTIPLTVYLRNRVSFTKQVLAGDDRPTAVVCYDPGTANSVYHAADVLGLRVPDDVSLITCSESRHSGNDVFTTTMLVPTAQAASVGASLLMSKIDNPTVTYEARLIPFGFEQGESCAPARRS
jgi:LacI family transcriptional regulator